MDTDRSDSVRKFPVLGDMPLIGHAFSYSDGDATDRELLIFITPHIVEGYDSLAPKSATADGREFAAARELDHFKSLEQDMALEGVQIADKPQWDVLKADREMMQKNASNALNPALDKEMNRALDIASQKNLRANHT